MLQTIYTRNVNYIASDLHKVTLAVSNIHANILDVVDTVKFISELWDENTDEINNFFQGYTSQLISLIESVIVYLTVGNSVKLLSDEVMSEIEDSKLGIQAKSTQFFVKGFLLSFLQSDNTNDLHHQQEVTNNDYDLKTLKEQAKQLKIKSWASYKNPEKLRDAIDRELDAMRKRFEAIL